MLASSSAERTSPRIFSQSERELCGIDHCQAGRSLVTAWNLPEAFLEITACHHEPKRTAGHRSLASAQLRVGGCAWVLGNPCRSPRSYAEILAEFPERRERGSPPKAKFASEIAMRSK
jgi:hypothetical protein